MDIELRHVSTTIAGGALAWRGVLHLDGRPLCVLSDDASGRPPRPAWMRGLDGDAVVRLDEALGAEGALWDECRRQATAHSLRAALTRELATSVLLRASDGRLLSVPVEPGEDRDALVDALTAEDSGALILERMPRDEAVAAWLAG